MAAEVSFIVPVYNAEKCIGRLIESVLEQEFTDLELILIDDGSKDGSGEIMDSWAEKDERVQVLHKPNSGVSDTRNRGLETAKGKYIRFLDADDWIPADSTKEMVRCAEEKEADLVVADFYRVVGENVSVKGSISSGDVLTRNEYAGWMMESPADYYYGVIWNKLYRRDIITRYGIRFDPSLSFCEDFIFNLEYILHTQKIAPLNVPVYYYVKTDGSLVSQNMNPMRIARMKATVFQYYDRFFRNILDEEEYRQQRPEILSFLIAAASDDLVIPLVKGTNKLGEETVPVTLFADENEDLYTFGMYILTGYQRYLNTAAMRNDMERKDLSVLTFLRHMGRDCSQKEIAQMTGISQLEVLSIIQRLYLKGLVSEEITSEGLYAGYLGSEKIDESLDQAMEDLKVMMTEGLEESVKQQMPERVVLAAKKLKERLK